MAIVICDFPSEEKRLLMIDWLIENVGPLNRQRVQSKISSWGTTWWMKAMTVNGGYLKWHVSIPDDNLALLFKLSCT
jgi:hypothetical protein